LQLAQQDPFAEPNAPAEDLPELDDSPLPSGETQPAETPPAAEPAEMPAEEPAAETEPAATQPEPTATETPPAAQTAPPATEPYTPPSTDATELQPTEDRFPTFTPLPDLCADGGLGCRREFEVLKDDTLEKIGPSIALSGAEGKDFPCICQLGDEQFDGRTWGQTCFEWKASALCHKPLYFEEVALERYGHACVLQPAVSAARFFATVPALPYEMGMRPPWECVYPLGHYRPGSCAPYYIPPVPVSLRGGLIEAGVVTGLVYIIP
jgi:hypothetical protein